jgi:hypothetical protein
VLLNVVIPENSIHFSDVQRSFRKSHSIRHVQAFVDYQDLIRSKITIAVDNCVDFPFRPVTYKQDSGRGQLKGPGILHTFRVDADLEAIWQLDLLHG